MSISLRRFCVAILVFLACWGGWNNRVIAHPAEAGSIVITLPSDIVITLPPDLEPDAREEFLRSLEGLDLPAVENEDAAAEVPWETEFATAVGRFDDALYGVIELPDMLGEWWATLGGGSASWLAVGSMLLAIALGLAMEWGLTHLLAASRQRILEASPTRFSGRLGMAVAWLALRLMGVAVFALGMFVGGWLFVPDAPAVLSTFGVIGIAIVQIRLVLLLIGQLLFSPHHPRLRLIPMPDADALVVWRWLLIAVVAPPTVRSLLTVLVETQGMTRAAQFVGLAVALVHLAARLGVFLGPRRQIRALILRAYSGPGDQVPGAARLFAETWHLILSGFAVLAFLIEVYALLSLEVMVVGSITGVLYLVLVPFVLGAWTALIQDLMIAGAAGTRRAVVGGIIQTLGQGVILLITFAGVALGLGADPFAIDGGIEDRIVGALFQAGAALLIGWALWNGVRILLEQYVPQEDEKASEEGMGKQGSRIETLVPVIRSFLLITIIAISGMIALSALGVQIGPLLAGAGVIGLAIGFGAQTLVRDVISGAFFLVEDAFRKGEYIVTSAGKGVVEDISLRSVRLRHHRGPLFTIPFGEIGTVQNDSRDWVKVKFFLHVPLDSDLEQVRKTIKRVGADLLQDPDLGDQFLAPLKWQGAVDIDGSAFVIGVKFISKPGEQFMIRRKAYQLLQTAFADAGLEFATPKVTVAGDDKRSLTPAKAVAAGQNLQVKET